MKEFKYLGYVLKQNGDQEAQIKDRMKRSATVMRQVWGIGENYGGNWGRKLSFPNCCLIGWYGQEQIKGKQKRDERKKNENFLRTEA